MNNLPYKPTGNNQKNPKAISEQRITRIIIISIILLAFIALAWPRQKYPTVNPDRLQDDPSIRPANDKVTNIEYGDFG
jgi:hypothetical protein